MSLWYNQNYSRNEIEAFLGKMKECVSNNQFTISLNANRQENIDFINEYNLRSDKQKRILLNIQATDFCHSLKNTNVGYAHEILYVFVPKVELFNASGKQEMVDIYTKFNMIDLSFGARTIVISFHGRNKPIDYLFQSIGK